MLKKCPKCGGTTLAPIKYCISVTDETQQRVANKEIFLVKIPTCTVLPLNAHQALFYGKMLSVS